MPYAVFAIEVQDYATWRRTYDARHGARLSAGIDNACVYREIDDPNSVTVVLEGELEKLRAYAAAADVNASYGPAGVIGKPHVRFVEDVT